MPNVKRQVYKFANAEPIAINTENLGFTPSSMYLSVESSDIRISYDGSAPTSMDGHRLYDSQTFTLRKPALIRQFRMIGVTAIPVTVNITLESA